MSSSNSLLPPSFSVASMGEGQPEPELQMWPSQQASGGPPRRAWGRGCPGRRVLHNEVLSLWGRFSEPPLLGI